MADEPVVEPVVEPTVTEPVAAEPEPQEPTHPLAPGGARFEEVYARMKQAEERAARMEGALAQSQQQQRPAQQGPVYADPAQLQALVDQGRITPMQATDILSRQNAQQAATQTTIAAIQAQQLNAKIQTAFSEVNQYLDKVPSLRDSNSQDFQKVSQEAYRVAEDMNLPVTDGRVQRVALRAVYGPLDRLAAASQARQQSREASLPHTESSVGRAAPSGTPKGPDPLKDVDPTYLKFWESRGYTREQMIDEAKYIPKGRKVRPAVGTR